MSEAVNGASSKTKSSQQKTTKHSKGSSWRGVPVFVCIKRYRIMTKSAKVSFRGVITMNRTSNTQGFNQSYYSDPGCRDFSTVRSGHRRNQKMLFQRTAVTDSG